MSNIQFYSTEVINDRITMIRSMTGELMYLIKGNDRAVLVDTCLGVGHLKEYVEKLTEKPVTVLITHGHIDHAMGAAEFSDVYMSHKDMPVYQSMKGLDDRKGYIMGNLGGFMPAFDDGDFVEEPETLACKDLTDGDSFDLGDLHLDVFALPGHTKGTMIVLIREERICYTLTDYEGEYERKSCMAENTGINSLMRYVSQETGIPADELDGVKVFSMANQGDEKSIAGLRKFVRHLAVLIHNCRCMFDPECFAIGGGISVQPLFLQMIKEELQNMNEIFPWKVSPPHVVVCKFFNDANLLGAVYVHLQAREKKLSIQKMDELMKLIGNRREAKYLKELLME